jgi:hypothetical protein
VVNDELLFEVRTRSDRAFASVAGNGFASPRSNETTTVWFDDPALEDVCEETAEEVVLIKDRAGRVIGFEKLNFKASDPEHLAIAINAAVT